MTTLEPAAGDGSERAVEVRLALLLRLALGGHMPDPDTAGVAWFDPDRLGEVIREFVHVQPFHGWADKIVGKPRDVAKRNVAKALGRWLPEDADELPAGLQLKTKEVAFLLHQTAQIADARDVSDSDLEEFQGPDGLTYGYTAEGARAARKRVCAKLARFFLEYAQRPPDDEPSAASTGAAVGPAPHFGPPPNLTASDEGTEDVVPAVFQVAFPRNKYFAGREGVLAALHERLHSAGAVTIAQTLSGEGGIGKTQVAVEYGYRYRASYDLVWWVNAEDTADIPRQLSDLALLLHLPIAAPLGTLDSQELRLSALRGWFDAHERWLLIFDNAENTTALGHVLPAGAGHVLITSRQQHWPAWTDVQLLDALDQEAAKEFLLTRTNDKDTVAALELARLTGGLPLALEQAAAYVVERCTTLAEYVSLYRHRGAELSERGEPSFYDHTVATTWTLALQDLSATLPAASVMLRVCSVLAADGAPRSLFDHASSDAPAGLQDAVVRHDALALLRRHSLLRLTGEGTLLTVHRLVAQQVRSSMGSTEHKEVVELAAALLAGLLAAHADHWPTHDRDAASLLGQVRAFSRHARKSDARLVYAVARGAALVEKRDMMARHQGRPMLDLAIDSAQTAFGAEDARVLPLLLQRAAARQSDLGGRDTRRLALGDLERALHLSQKNHGEQSWQAAAVHLKVAFVLAGLHWEWVDFELADADFEAADSHAGKALELLGPVANDHDELWRHAHRIAAHIAAHRGDLQRAEELLAYGLPRETGESSRTDRWHLASHWRSAGMLMMRFGAVERALPYLLTAVEVEFGDEPLGSLSDDECARYLAVVYTDQEDWVALKELRERTLERTRRSRNNDISLRFALDYLASVESKLSDTAAAEGHRGEALALAEKHLRLSLDRILGADQDPEEPLASTIDRATQVVNEASDTLRFSALTTDAAAVANLMLDLGKESDALRILRSNVEFECAVHAHEERKPPTGSALQGRRHRFDGYAWKRLGDALQRIGQHEDACDSYRAAWAVHGHEQSETCYQIALSQAACKHALGRDDEALVWLEQAEAAGINEPARHGATFPCETFWRLQALADLSADCGATGSADRLFKRAMEAEAAAHGARHPLVSAGAYNYAWFLRRQKRTEEALAMADMALEVGAATWGEGSPRTAKRRTLIEELRKEMATR